MMDEHDDVALSNVSFWQNDCTKEGAESVARFERLYIHFVRDPRMVPLNYIKMLVTIFAED